MNELHATQELEFNFLSHIFFEKDKEPIPEIPLDFFSNDKPRKAYIHLFKGFDPVSDYEMFKGFLSDENIVQIISSISTEHGKSIGRKLKDLYKRRIQATELLKSYKDVVDLSKPRTQTNAGTFEDGVKSLEDDIKHNPFGYASGFRELDSIAGGIAKDGWLTGIVGESEAGKTTIGLNLIDRIIKSRSDLKFGIASLEMGDTGLTDFMYRINTGVCRSSLSTQALSEQGLNRNWLKHYSKCKITYNAYTLDLIKDFIDEQELDFLLIDHLQFMRNNHKGEGLGEWVNRCTSTLKKLAKQYNCAIVILSQIDKQASTRAKQGGGRPRISDAYGGIGFKAGLDLGLVILRKEENSILYCDKCRLPWDSSYRYSDFSIDIDPKSGQISQIYPAFINN
jgi:hypothetical protein